MRHKLLLAVWIVLWLGLLLGLARPSLAQTCGPQNPNCVVPDRPAGDSTNSAANTRFVAAAAALPPGRSVTANATIAPTDCNTTIQAGTGSTGQFTVTLPSTTGFPTNCTVAVKNGDTGRAKFLSGFPTDLLDRLWPLQTAAVKIIGGAWATSANPGRYLTQLSVTLRVDPTNGLDTNDGLVFASALQTVTKAMQLHQRQILYSGGTAFIQISSAAPTTVAESLNCTGPLIGGAATITITGDTVTPTNVVWTPPTGLVGVFANYNCNISISGVAFRPGANTPCAYLDSTQGGIITYTAVDFGVVPAGAGCGYQVLIGHGGTANALGDFTISGNMTYHGLCVGDSTWEWVAGTVSMPNALTFTNFISISGPCNVNFDQTTTFSGPGSGSGSTGSQYSVYGNGSLFTNSSTLPGNALGVLTVGGCADVSCASSGWALLNTLTASNSATLSDTISFTARYDDYVLVIDNIVPVTNAVNFELLVHSGGAFKNTVYLNTSAVTTYIDMNGANALGNNAGIGYGAVVYIHSVNNPGVNKWVQGRGSLYSGAAIFAAAPGGFWNGGQGVVDGFQLKMDSGNISTGSVKVYGIVKQ